MNRQSKTYITLFILLFSAGCQDDLLDTIPNDRITSAIVWRQEKDAILAANAIYTFLDDEKVFSRDALSDIAHTNKTYVEQAAFEKGIFNALSDLVEEEWAVNYQGIRAANYFLEKVDLVPTSNTDLIEGLKGEVRVLRAYLYVNLVFIFGNVPLVTKPISIEEGRNLVQSPASDVWDFISKELTEAALQLPVTQTETGRITKGAALALKARAMLYAKRYQDAAEAAQSVMDLDAYTLYPNFKDLFSYAAENNSEIILDKQFLKDIYPNDVFYILAPWSQTFDGGSLYVPLKKIVDAYEMTNGKRIDEAGSGFDPYDPYANRDPRLLYSMFLPGSELPDGEIFDPRPNSETADALGQDYHASQTGASNRKYINKEDIDDIENGGMNITLIRFAEVLLTYAEAKIELNQLDASVYDAINEVRQRPDVNMPVIAGGKSQDELREIVRHERMVELAFEGQRFFDIRRWGIAEDVFNVPLKGVTYIDENGDLYTVEIPAIVRNFDPSKHYLWPIPQKELDLNKNFEQNEGW